MEQQKLQILEIDLDRDKAKKEYNLYKDHPLQPKGYNIFIHNPPKNPENRVLLDLNKNPYKVMVGENDLPIEWKEEELGETWEWSTEDTWAWLEAEDGKMYNIMFTTTQHEIDKLRNIDLYFQEVLKKDVNIYEQNDKFAKYLPEGLTYREMYEREILNARRKIKELGMGHLKRDEDDPDLIIHACIPESNLSNEILEKWRGPILEFILGSWDRIDFSQGDIS